MHNKKLRLASVLGAGILMLGVPTISMTQQAAAQQVRQASVGNLIAALNNIAVEIENLQVLNDLTVRDVRVVNVEDVLNNNNVEAFNNALNSIFNKLSSRAISQ